MKNSPILILFVLFPMLLKSQNQDSVRLVITVDSMIQTHSQLLKAASYEESLSLIQKAKETVSQSEYLGKSHALYASCLACEGRSLFALRKLEAAASHYLEAKDLQAKILGKAHPDYLGSLNNLGVIYKHLGFYDKALDLQLEVKDLRKEALGNAHPDYAASLTNVGNLYSDLGRFEKAEPLLLEAQSIREKALGQDHPHYMESLNNLGVLYVSLAQYERAEDYFLKVQDYREKMYGRAHPQFAYIQMNLALLYLELGQYEQSEALLLGIKALMENELQMQIHPLYVICLDYLGALYQEVGQFDRAETLFLSALEISKKVNGKDHPEYADQLSSLGNIYLIKQQYEQAEDLFQKARSLREKSPGKAHPAYAGTLIKLAIVAEELGQLEKAERLYLETKQIFERDLDMLDHPFYNHCLGNLGSFYQVQGLESKAEPLFLQKKAIVEERLGKEHPDYATCLMQLGTLYHQMEQPHLAESYFMEAASHQQSLLTRASHYSSEQELAQYVRQFSDDLQKMFAFAHTQVNFIQTFPELCYNQALFYKGFLLHTAKGLHQMARSDSASVGQYYLWKSYQRRLGELYALPKDEQTGLNALTEKANHLEKALIQNMSGFGQAIRQVSWQQVQSRLKPGEAAIEMVHYQMEDSAAADSVMYAALLIMPNSAPQFIPLFGEKTLKYAISNQQAQIGLLTSRGVKPRKGKEQAISKLDWGPLNQALEGIQTLYFSPTGLMHLLNLNASMLTGNKTFADQYHLIQLNSTRQLVNSPTRISAEREAVLFGGIEYELAPDTALPLDSISEQESLSFVDFDGLPAKRRNQESGWTHLHWTKKEVESIHKTLNGAQFTVQRYMGPSATEETFKEIGRGQKAPAVLHVATHGYFFPDPSYEFSANTAGAIFKNTDHPMMRSGLILAGANHVWKGNRPGTGREDGILTAFEISQMDLSQTELVVLSACETGLGDIKGHEGVYGLQRAFKIAGAQYLIMSLWQVPDQETMVFMETFYRQWLTVGMSIPEAFRATQQIMQEHSSDPSVWAAFILVE